MRVTFALTILSVLVLGIGVQSPAYSQSHVSAEAQRTLETLGVPYTLDAFCQSVKDDELTLFKLFHAAGTDLETRCSHGRTPLFIAVDYGSDRIYRYLMDNDVEVFAINSVGSTPLVRAISHKRYDIVYELLRAGAPAFPTPQTAENPLYMGNTALGYALLDCDPRLVKDLLKAHADANQILSPIHGGTALLRAVDTCPSVIKVLSEAGADINAKDVSGMTALHHAINTDKPSLDTIHILLEAGARTDLRNNSGWTPTIFAVLVGDKYVVRILLDYGVDPNNTFKLTQDSFPSAFARNKSLIDAASNGMSLLMLAAGYGNLEAVQVLLEYGADPNYAVTGAIGRHTAKSLAKAIGRENIATLLP